MKLSEILREADGQPLELRDVVKFFPHTYKKVFNAKWGQPDSLVFHGHPFFTHDDEGDHALGSAYAGVDDAVDEYIKDRDFKIEVELTMDLSKYAENHDVQYHDHDFTFEAAVSDKQEVYLGYSIHEDCLYAGYDAWIHEEDFNEAWDRHFQHATGDRFDWDDEDHQEVFQKVWDHFKNQMGYGLLFKVAEHGGRWKAAEVEASQGGFYKGIKNGHNFQHYDLVDLRLD